MLLSFFTDLGRPIQYGTHKNGNLPKLKACYSNQRQYIAAIEDYNMDNSEIIKTALPGYDFEELDLMLQKKNYLKEPIFPPTEKCSYGIIVASDSSYKLFCKLHGIIKLKDTDNPSIPEYDKSMEKPFSKSYKDKKDNYFNRMKFGNSFSQILQYAFSSIFFTIPLIICFFQYFKIFFNKKKKI